jgi:hypothetical protein
MRRRQSRLDMLARDVEVARQQEALLEAVGQEVLERTRVIAKAIEQKVIRLTQNRGLQTGGRDNEFYLLPGCSISKLNTGAAFVAADSRRVICSNLSGTAPASCAQISGGPS